MQMLRRFVNLVVHDYATGARSLHRLDVAKHLFYPSTALADEAAASAKNKEKENINGKPPARRIRRSGVLRRLPPATMSLQWLPAAADNNPSPSTHYIQETFALLAGGGGDDGRILHAGELGHLVLYDAGGSGSTTALPDLALPDIVRHGRPIFFISSIAGAGAGTGKEEKKKESIYVITDPYLWHRQHSFQVLDIHPDSDRLEWEPLPLPPFAARYPCSAVKSFAVLDDDVDGGRRTICVSSSSSSSSSTETNKGKGKGTYCFDTTSREWRKAGGWTLPFHGRAEHVPELGSCYAHDDWLRSRSSAGDYGRQYLPASSVPDDYLCAATSDDLLLSAAAAAAMDAPPRRRGAPKLQHVWQDKNPADEEEWIELRGRLRGIVLQRIKQWVLGGRDLIDLGGGRFCVAKLFRVQRVVRFGGYSDDDDIEREAEFVELSGVELVREGGGDGGEGELRMVMHKSKRYMFTNDEIEWVL